MESKEHPIIFSSESIRAILDGSKKQTRRIPNKQNVKWEVGDRLWVKETHKIAEYDNYGQGPVSKHIFYKADNWTQERWNEWQKTMGKFPPSLTRWKPSRFMPKWAARIWREITGIRKERLQDISEEDAIAEGVPEWANKDDIANDHYLDRPLEPYWCPVCQGQGVHPALGSNLGVIEIECENCDTSIKLFRNFWDSLNKKRGYGWDENHEVIVFEFKKISKDI